MHNIEPLIIILLTIVYLFIGYPFTKWLCENWAWLNKAAKANELIEPVVHVAWAPTFIVLVCTRLWELLTESRAKDWRENEAE